MFKKLSKKLTRWINKFSHNPTETEKALFYANQKVYNIYDFPYKLFNERRAGRGIEHCKTYRNVTECKPMMFMALNDHPPKGKYLLPTILGTLEQTGKVTWFEIFDRNMLVSGQSRSGKTTWLTSMIISLCHFSDPEYLRVCIADPKNASFKKLSQVCDVAKSYEEVTDMINMLVEELEERKQHLSESPFSNLRDANAHAYRCRQLESVRPYIVFVFDEFAHYIEECKAKSKEKNLDALGNIDKLQKLVSIGLSNGIHLILATQAPYKEVVKGLIKNNLSMRISFELGGREQDQIALGTRNKDQKSTTHLNQGEFLHREKGDRVQYKSVLSTDTCSKNAVEKWSKSNLCFKVRQNK